MPKLDFNKVAKQLCWNHASAWLFSCTFVAYFQNTFSYEYAASEVYLEDGVFLFSKLLSFFLNKYDKFLLQTLILFLFNEMMVDSPIFSRLFRFIA